MAHDPHIVDVVRRMKGERRPDAEIAMSVGMTEDSLKWLCHKHRIRRPVVRTLPVSAEVLEAFRAEAVRRGERLEPFTRNVLKKIIHPNKKNPSETLFAAILDDGK